MKTLTEQLNESLTINEAKRTKVNILVGRFQPFFPVWLREALRVGMRSTEGRDSGPGLTGPHWGPAGR